MTIHRGIGKRHPRPRERARACAPESRVRKFVSLTEGDSVAVAKRGKRATERGRASTCEDVLRFTRRSVERLPRFLPHPLSRR